MLHLKWILNTDWREVSLLNDSSLQFSNKPYLIFSVIAAVGVILLAACLFYHFYHDRVKQLFLRQKLAKMILEKKWYESEQVRRDGLFKDWPSDRTKERITHFPKMYYQLKDGLIHIHVEITLGKYQGQLLP